MILDNTIYGRIGLNVRYNRLTTYRLEHRAFFVGVLQHGYPDKQTLTNDDWFALPSKYRLQGLSHRPPANRIKKCSHKFTFLFRWTSDKLFISICQWFGQMKLWTYNIVVVVLRVWICSTFLWNAQSFSAVIRACTIHLYCSAGFTAPLFTCWFKDNIQTQSVFNHFIYLITSTKPYYKL